MHLIVLVEVQPGAIRAWLAIDTIGEDPRILLRREEHTRLALREQFIIDSNVAVWRSSNCDALFDILALLVVINFSCAWATENLQFQLNCIIIQVYVEVGWDVQRLLLSLTRYFIVHMGLQVLVLSYQAALHDIDDDIRLSNVDQHVVLQRLYKIQRIVDKLRQYV